MYMCMFSIKLIHVLVYVFLTRTHEKENLRHFESNINDEIDGFVEVNSHNTLDINCHNYFFRNRIASF